MFYLTKLLMFRHCCEPATQPYSNFHLSFFSSWRGRQALPNALTSLAQTDQLTFLVCMSEKSSAMSGVSLLQTKYLSVRNQSSNRFQQTCFNENALHRLNRVQLERYKQVSLQMHCMNNQRVKKITIIANGLYGMNFFNL